MCIAVGKVSFDDCDMFTWSFGWIGALLPSSAPTSCAQRLAMTSLTFMFDCVPEPVCHTYSGNSLSSSAVDDLVGSALDQRAHPLGRWPAPVLTRAAAFLTMP